MVGNDGKTLDDVKEHVSLSHLLILTITWAGLANIGLIAPLFRHTIFAYYLHSVIMWLVVIFTLVGSFLPIVGEGGQLHEGEQFHEIMGFIVVGVTLIICIMGVWVRFTQQSPTISASMVRKSRLAHMVSGIIYYLLAQMTLLSAWWIRDKTVFYALFIYQILFMIFRTLFKYCFPGIQKQAKDYQTEKSDISDIRIIKKEKDLEIYSRNYCIFSDYVYSLEKVYNSHPGGYQIISKIRQREIDRFLYGMEPLEILGNSVPKFAHSRWSMNLAGAPIAKFERYNAYEGMKEWNDCKISSLRKISSNSDAYLIELALKEDKFTYKGFKNVSELGQYFSITIGNSKTRLYCAVNSLTYSNRVLMGSISDEMKENNFEQILKTKTDLLQTKRRIQDEYQSFNTLPLIIKKYENGSFTSDLISPSFNSEVMVSCGKGNGLGLHEKSPGKIIVLAGGTGICPFVDLIDVLFKRTLCQQGHSLKNRILNLNPEVMNDCFNKFSYTILGSFRTHEDIHPITLYQLKYLAQVLPSEKFNYQLNIKSLQRENSDRKYRDLRLTKDRFENYLDKQLVSEDAIDRISHIYVCGPTPLTASVLGNLEGKKVSHKKFTIM